MNYLFIATIIIFVASMFMGCARKCEDIHMLEQPMYSECGNLHNSVQIKE